MVPFLQGVGTGAGLIIAIGVQNSFVLSQGVKRQYHFTVPLICVLCDVVLIITGALGVGSFIASRPHIVTIAGIGGALFLIWYGLKSLSSALRPGFPRQRGSRVQQRKSIVLTTLVLSLCNPHVYFDTVILLGSLSGQYSGLNRLNLPLGHALLHASGSLP